MKIVIASDSFKGCSSSIEAARAFESGIKKIFPDADVVKVPVADGGEGTVTALASAQNGEFRDVEVTGPLGQRVVARYGKLEGNVAVMEMAAASGLTLIPEGKLDPLAATTYGTGEMLLGRI